MPDATGLELPELGELNRHQVAALVGQPLGGVGGDEQDALAGVPVADLPAIADAVAAWLAAEWPWDRIDRHGR